MLTVSSFKTVGGHKTRKEGAVSLTNSVMRLQRAGDPNSVANKKLLEAAKQVADSIIRKLLPLINNVEWVTDGTFTVVALHNNNHTVYKPWKTQLPGYFIGHETSICGETKPNITVLFWRNPFTSAFKVVGEDSYATRQFAEDIALGLLPRVEEMVKERRR